MCVCVCVCIYAYVCIFMYMCLNKYVYVDGYMQYMQRAEFLNPKDSRLWACRTLISGLTSMFESKIGSCHIFLMELINCMHACITMCMMYV